MATTKLDREEVPDFDEAQDVSYEEGSQDAGGGNVSQEWQGRKK